MISKALLAALMLAAPTPVAEPDSHAAPKPGVLKTFGDWTVGCDNTRICTMASLLPDDGAGAGMTLNLTRYPGPGGQYQVSPGEGVTDATGRRGATRYVVDGRDVGANPDAIAAAMATGRVLRLSGGTVSLKGASAALRYIDAMQGRAGTVTATVAKGPAPATAVPAMSPRPVVVAQGLTPYAKRLPATVVATMKRIGRCDLPDGMGSTPDVVRTSGGRLLAIQPCSAGAYNVIGALFVIDGTRVTPAEVDAPAGFEATGADSQTPVHSVINGTFGGDMLTSYAKGRGLGDCGSSQGFAWDGKRYRLVTQDDMRECRGNTNFIATWRAIVRR